MCISLNLVIRTFAMLVLLSAHASANELAPLESTELHDRCQAHARSSQSAEGSECVAYLRGFLESSTLIHVENATTPAETFAERALRTRYGRAGLTRPNYCIDSSTGIDDLIIQLLVQAESTPPKQGELASTLIYATLARFHRCGDRRTNQ